MSRIKLSALDSKNISSSELQARLDELANWINGPNIEGEDLEPRGIQHRHILRPLKTRLGLEFGTKFGAWLMTSFVYNTVTYYYPATPANRYLKVTGTNRAGGENPRNVYEDEAPAGIVYANVFVNNMQGAPTPTINNFALNAAALEATSRAYLAYSTDLINWTVITGGYRTLRQSNGSLPGFFSGGYQGQNHYITGAATYTPVNFNYDRCVKLLAAFGPGTGINESGSSDPLYWTVCFDDNEFLQIYGQLFADVRTN